MDTASQLQAMGLTMPTPAYFAGMILFSILGMVAYVAGKRRQKSTTKWLGVALMFYSYVASVTWVLYLVGIALCAAVVWDWQREA
jgi:hypothetical protein